MTRNIKSSVLLLFFISLLWVGCKPKSSTLTLFAAAGTRLATEEVCNLFEKNEVVKVDRNYASSGTLAKQIANGAPGNVYISANKQWVDYLVKQGEMDSSSVSKLGGNRLAVVVPVNSSVDTIPTLDALKEFMLQSDKISIGDPGYVPVGKYAKQALSNLEWFAPIEEKLVLAKDVSSVLHFVELGECDFGIVYRSEASRSEKVKSVFLLPDSLHQPITFYIGTLKNGGEKAEKLKAMFLSEEAKNIFSSYGFIIE